jgi:hypothetical protein
VGVPGFAGRDREHLKLALRHQGRVMEAIGFGLGALPREGGFPSGKVDVAYSPCVNRWRGQARLQLELKAIRPAGG